MKIGWNTKKNWNNPKTNWNDYCVELLSRVQEEENFVIKRWIIQMRETTKWRKIEIFDSILGAKQIHFFHSEFRHQSYNHQHYESDQKWGYKYHTKHHLCWGEHTHRQKCISKHIKCTPINAIETYKLKSRSWCCSSVSSQQRGWFWKKKQHSTKRINVYRAENSLVGDAHTHIERVYSFCISVVHHKYHLVTFVIRHVAHRNLCVIQSNTKCSLFASKQTTTKILYRNGKSVCEREKGSSGKKNWNSNDGKKIIWFHHKQSTSKKATEF